MSEFKDNTLTGSKPADASPITKAAPSDGPGGMLTMATAGTADEPNVEIALRWARVYQNDHEFKDFWKWLGERSNPERTDQREVLDSIPVHFAPEQLPLPLRKFFLRKFGSAG